MLTFATTDLRKWADSIGVESLTFAEHDYRLVAALEAIYSQSQIPEKLLIKGGTALNKLYLRETSRLSVDLDFNQIGEKTAVLSERGWLRNKMREALTQQDSSYQLSNTQNYSQTTIKAKYQSIITPMTRQLKLEVSHIERIPILKPESRETNGTQKLLKVPTYAIEELAATKVRALFERFKGRDIYDLYFILKLKSDKILLKKLFLYYFYRSRKIYNPKIHFRILSRRLRNGGYDDDVSGFVRPTVSFQLDDAALSVERELAFLNEFDDNDTTFLALARQLLKKGKITNEMRVKVSKIKNPLNELFKGQGITERAEKANLGDIAIFSK